MRKTILAGIVALGASLPLLAGGAALAAEQPSGARPMANNPACEARAASLNKADPKHHYVCTNKLNNVTGWKCQEGAEYWRRQGAINTWCTADPWPLYDLDVVVKTR
ncbi:hypothetical protein [Amycolatopsis samaneae]|uniref:Hemolysin n=1 Tax=Amycolatopsis samaneae TaxID=664691 RepID=A0ABW5GGM0_9PSEU